MDSELTRLLPVTVPVIAAPMAGVADSQLAIAVSRAGALGCIGIGSTQTPEWIESQLADISGAGVPFGVGLMAWALQRDPTALELALAAKPTLVSISFGDTVEELAPWVERARATGAAVAVQAGTVAEAVAAERVGASLVVARGGEAGGHGRNEVATLPLLQEVLDVVSTPVVAAGGIASARGLAAVLAAGAAGAWVGTAFAGCSEATSSASAKQAMSRAAASETTYSRVFDIAQRLAWPKQFGGRALRNDFSRDWVGRETELAAQVAAQDSDPTITITAELLRARAEAYTATAPVYCGQGVGQIAIDRPAAEVVAEFARAAGLLQAAARRLPDSGSSSVR